MKDKTFRLVPFKMHRAGGGGFLAQYRREFGYELIYEKLKGTEVVETHGTAITGVLYRSLLAQAKKNFKQMAAIIGPEDKGYSP